MSRRQDQRYWLGRAAAPYLYSAPVMSLFFLLMLFPMAMVFRYSVLDGAILKPNPEFVGIANFQTIFSDPVFVQSIGNTLYFTVMSVAFHLLIGLLFALMLNSDRQASLSATQPNSTTSAICATYVIRQDSRSNCSSTVFSAIVMRVTVTQASR